MKDLLGFILIVLLVLLIMISTNFRGTADFINSELSIYNYLEKYCIEVYSVDQYKRNDSFGYNPNTKELLLDTNIIGWCRLPSGYLEEVNTNNDILTYLEYKEKGWSLSE